jgi:hypothetical protein
MVQKPHHHYISSLPTVVTVLITAADTGPTHDPFDRRDHCTFAHARTVKADGPVTNSIRREPNLTASPWSGRPDSL